MKVDGAEWIALLTQSEFFSVIFHTSFFSFSLYFFKYLLWTSDVYFFVVMCWVPLTMWRCSVILQSSTYTTLDIGWRGWLPITTSTSDPTAACSLSVKESYCPGLKKQNVSSPQEKDPLWLSSKLPGALKSENWPLAVGVDVVISGLEIVGESVEKEQFQFKWCTYPVLNELRRGSSLDIWYIFFILPNPLVVAQKRKSVRMEPCGEPPVSIIGLNLLSLICTLIFPTEERMD